LRRSKVRLLSLVRPGPTPDSELSKAVNPQVIEEPELDDLWELADEFGYRTPLDEQAVFDLTAIWHQRLASKG
jgi:hypothetical protein